MSYSLSYSPRIFNWAEHFNQPLILWQSNRTLPTPFPVLIGCNFIPFIPADTLGHDVVLDLSDHLYCIPQNQGGGMWLSFVGWFASWLGFFASWLGWFANWFNVGLGLIA